MKRIFTVRRYQIGFFGSLIVHDVKLKLSKRLYKKVIRNVGRVKIRCNKNYSYPRCILAT
jgi:hypothetical protein